MQKLLSLLNIIDNMSEWSGRIVCFLISLMLASMTYEVVVRYAFNAPTDWAYEISEFCSGTAMIIGGAYTLRHASHVNVDIAYARFSPRGKAILDLVSSVLFFAFIGVLVYFGAQFAWKALKFLEHSDSLWSPPLYPFKIALFIGASLVFLQGLAKFIRDLTTAITGREVVTREEMITGREAV